MIQGIILDIDGVIIGEKIGFNSPYPHPDVIKSMQKIRSSGVPIVLCTAKPYFAISKIIKNSGLDNFHIVEGGALIFDPLKNQILEKHIINRSVALQLVESLLENSIYVEIYDADSYSIQVNQTSKITEQHSYILQRKPVVVEMLKQKVETTEIIKVISIARNTEEQQLVEDFFQIFREKLTLHWATHPIALPLQFGIITEHGISKASAVQTVFRTLNIPLGSVLGVGDSTSDWEFLQYCGSVGVMENASDELKMKTASKGDSCFSVPHVNENGILKAFEHFKLLI